MDVFKTMNTINKFGKLFVTLVILLSFASIMFATNAVGANQISNALRQLCNDARSLLFIAAIMLVILAAVTYSAGQVLGAETRARASVWATSMMIGAIIGIIIYVILPPVIGTLAGTNGGSIGGTGNPCDTTVVVTTNP